MLPREEKGYEAPNIDDTSLTDIGSMSKSSMIRLKQLSLTKAF